MGSHAGSPGEPGALGFDPALETAALDRLVALDGEGCRRELGRLLARMEASLASRPDRVGALLLDILHKINFRLHRPDGDGEAYQRQRRRLIQSFAGCNNRAAVEEAFCDGLDGLLADLRPGPRHHNPLVDRARALIHDRYQQRISLSEVAGTLGVSANYLSGVFRRETGWTLTAYIQRVRLEHARLLLADDRRTISEIAYQVGYQTYRDFYRNVVKYERRTPRELRRGLHAGPQPGRSADFSSRT